MSGTLAIVGAGRVGKSLGQQLHRKGWRIGAVVTRSRRSARAAVRAIGAGQPLGALDEQILASNIVLITTPDSQVEPVAAALAKIGGQKWRGKVVLHTSGALGVDVLQPLAKAGAATGSLHPMQTFGEQRAVQLEGRVFGIDGVPAALRAARTLVRHLAGVPVRLLGADRAAYHSAGLFACSHVLALMEAATRILMAQGFTRKQSLVALLPLARQTLDNFEKSGAREAWTGPMNRGDFSTVARHAKALRAFPREYLSAYEALSMLAGRVLAPNAKATSVKLDRALGTRRKSQGKGRTKRFVR